MDNDFKDVDGLVNLAGTFWSNLYEDNLFRYAVAARGLTELQVHEDCQTFSNCANRYTTPVYRKILWQPIKFVASIGRINAMPFAAVPVLTNRISNPNIVLIESLDYSLTNGQLFFQKDIFTRTELTPEPIFDDKGETHDRSITLWGHGCLLDEKLMYERWGAVIGLEAPSSQMYNELICLVYDAIVGGVTELQIRRILGLLYGTPICKKTTEIMGYGKDSKGSFVITDDEVYRLVGKPIHTIGTKVVCGTPLCDALEITQQQNTITCTVNTKPIYTLKAIDIHSLLRIVIPPHVKIQFKNKGI
jgi:hypothetical protein